MPRSEQVKAGKYKHPHQIHKVPVEAYFFYHFIMAAALVGTIDGIDKHQDKEDDTRGNVEAMEAGDGKEVIKETVRRLYYLRGCCIGIRRQGGFKEMFVGFFGYAGVGKAAPPATFVVHVGPFPGLAA